MTLAETAIRRMREVRTMRDDSDKVLVYFLVIIGGVLSCIGLLSVLSYPEFKAWLLLISGIVCAVVGLLLPLLPKSMAGMLRVVTWKQNRIERQMAMVESTSALIKQEQLEVLTTLAEIDGALREKKE